jgi:hypothetical protein
MRKAFFILLFFISSCGYQPIYINKNLKNFEFNKIILNGNSKINEKIINALSIKEDEAGKNQNKLFISSSFQNEETSKNSKGKVELYRTIVSVNLKIINLSDKIIQDKNFLKEFTYNNKENKFELVEYQNSIRNDLTDKIIGDIIIFLNL